MGTGEDYLERHAVTTPADLLDALKLGRKPNSGRLGDVLIEAGAITPEALNHALFIQSQQPTRRLGDILIDLGIASIRLIQMALSRKFGIPYVNAGTFPIVPGALEVIEKAFAIRHQVLPLMLTNSGLVVAIENPFAAEFLEDLRFQAGMSVDTVIANPRSLEERIAKEYAALDARPLTARGRDEWALRTDGLGSGGEAALEIHVNDLTSQLDREMKANARSSRDTVTIDSRVSENTLVRLVNKIIFEAHEQGASDIHIESNAGINPTRIRFRKDGELEDYLDLPHTYSHSLISRIKIMADLDISERRHPQDGKIDFGKHGPLAIELRVAVIPTANNLEDVVLRILASSAAVPLSQIGFSPEDFKALKSMIARNYGFVLVCGPTGSGKTTTLHSLLREINRPDVKIWTAEDPVEITQPGLRQVQVNKKIDWTFAAAMRAFLRADPDVIMVGEMRDVETCKIAIEASLTGHLVFSTLHTNSATETVVRLLDLGMDPFNFADALVGVISQRLVRKLCLKCRTRRTATPRDVEELLDEYCLDGNLDRGNLLRHWREHYFTDGNLVLHEAAGCAECKDGYKGRIVTYELLKASTELKHLVRIRAPVPELLAVALQEGMVSLRQNALLHVLAGNIDIPSARAVANST
jgi:type II secretory ATPase GspE/PulE/Tfp pilus assembly ATPase PilB-like protein